MTVIYVHAKNMLQTNFSHGPCIWLVKQFMYTWIWTKLYDQKNVSHRNPQTLINIFVKGEKIKFVSDVEYLGIILDLNLSFKKHVKKVANYQIQPG